MQIELSRDRIVNSDHFAIPEMGLLSLLAASGFLFPLFRLSHFWTSDDVFNLLNSSGGYTGRPEILNPVIGPEVGLLVTSLYRITSEVPWYPIILVLFPVICLFSLIRDVSRYVQTRQLSFALVAIAVPLLSLIGAKPNYTLSAFVCAATSTNWLIFRLFGSFTLQRMWAPLWLCLMSISLRTDWPSDRVLSGGPYLFAVFVACCLVACTPSLWNLQFGARALGLLATPLLAHKALQLSIMARDAEWTTFLDFYYSRGALNGNSSVIRYLEMESADSIRQATGLNQLEIYLLRNWALFDSSNPTTSELDGLYRAAKDWNSTNGVIAAVTGPLWSAVQFLVQFGVLIPLILLIAGSVAQSTRSSSKRLNLILSTVAVSLPLALVGLTAHRVRMPDYVAIGCATTVVVSAVILASINAELAKEGFNGRRAGGAIIFLGSLTFSLLAALPDTVEAVLRFRTNFELASETRSEFESTKTSSFPIVGDPTVWSRGYQFAPFDVQVPESYAQSMDFSGGSNIRSPMHLRRWNVITGQNDTDASLFSASFWSRVKVYRSLAIELQAGYLQELGFCIRLHPSSHETFRLVADDGCKSDFVYLAV